MSEQDNTTQATQDAGSGLPLFYKNPVALEAAQHQDLSLKQDFGFSFAREVNAVPINLIEMPQISHIYPIAFSNDGSATPVAIMGLRDKENLFVQDNGYWEADTYIPAYIRRYPFIFSENSENDKLTLCVDYRDEFVVEDTSQPFFDKEGNPTQLSKNALEFCKSYHAATQQTVAFSKALAKSELLIDRQADINIKGNRRITFSGFSIIDEKKLADLPDKTFLEWREKGWLPFVYAHLFSGVNWQRLTRMVNQRIEPEAA